MRSPATDPQPGDALSLKGYRITVEERIESLIRYSVSKKGSPSRQSTQDLAEWSAWAGAAKVVERSGDCYVMANCIGGCCTACREPLENEVHIVDMALLHKRCCIAKRHGKPSNSRGIAA